MHGITHYVGLTYDQKWEKLAVGIVHTNYMTQRLLDDDLGAGVSFGYGINGYKAD